VFLFAESETEIPFSSWARPSPVTFLRVSRGVRSISVLLFVTFIKIKINTVFFPPKTGARSKGSTRRNRSCRGTTARVHLWLLALPGPSRQRPVVCCARTSGCPTASRAFLLRGGPAYLTARSRFLVRSPPSPSRLFWRYEFANHVHLIGKPQRRVPVVRVSSRGRSVWCRRTEISASLSRTSLSFRVEKASESVVIDCVVSELTRFSGLWKNTRPTILPERVTGTDRIRFAVRNTRIKRSISHQWI